MFPGSTIQTGARIVNGELLAFEADCPQEFKQAIMKCFAANPESRPRALEILEIVETIQCKHHQSNCIQEHLEVALDVSDKSMTTMTTIELHSKTTMKEPYVYNGYATS